jgi:hypothetical protein
LTYNLNNYRAYGGYIATIMRMGIKPTNMTFHHLVLAPKSEDTAFCPPVLEKKPGAV